MNYILPQLVVVSCYPKYRNIGEQIQTHVWLNIRAAKLAAAKLNKQTLESKSNPFLKTQLSHNMQCSTIIYLSLSI